MASACYVCTRTYISIVLFVLFHLMYQRASFSFLFRELPRTHTLSFRRGRDLLLMLPRSHYYHRTVCRFHAILFARCLFPFSLHTFQSVCASLSARLYSRDIWKPFPRLFGAFSIALPSTQLCAESGGKLGMCFLVGTKLPEDQIDTVDNNTKVRMSAFSEYRF